MVVIDTCWVALIQAAANLSHPVAEVTSPEWAAVQAEAREFLKALWGDLRHKLVKRDE